MHKILALWGVPRSTSTAFEWMMRQRGDMQCFHEPFGEAWYRGEDARAPRVTADTPRKPGLSFASVLEQLRAAARARKVFSKDMPQFADHLWNDDFLGQFRHSFLIRNPARVLASLKRSYEKKANGIEFTREEIGFDAQRRLFDRLAERDGETPVVIDSDDLLRDPSSMVAAYCRAMGIPFIAEALSWEPGSRAEVLWYDSDDSIWHETLKNSDGLKPQPCQPVEVTELPAPMQALYEAFLPHYRHLHAHRLTVDPGESAHA